MFPNYASVLREDLPPYSHLSRLDGNMLRRLDNDGPSSDDGDMGWDTVRERKGRKGGRRRLPSEDRISGDGQRRTRASAGDEALAGAKELRVLATMWKCPHCKANSFLARHRCFVCERPRPARPALVKEKWKEWALPRRVQEAAIGEEAVGQRRGRNDRETDGEERGFERRERGRHGRSNESEEERRPNGLVEWADVVKAGIGINNQESVLAARSKAKAKPKGKGKDEPKGGAGRNEERREGGNLARDEGDTVEGVEAGGEDKDEKEKEGWLPSPQPYAPPPLPRFLLAERAKALGKRVAEMEDKDPSDPRIAVARAHQEATGAQVREAGGHSSRRLCFSVLEAESKIHKCENALRKAEEVLEKSSESVKEVLLEHEKAEANVEACRGHLLNAKAKRAHLGFQVAVDASREVDGFDELMSSFALLSASVQSSGSKSTNEALVHVERFIRQFQPTQYDAKEDPILNEVASIESRSSQDTLLMEWQAGEVRGEKRPLQAEAGPEDDSADAALERVNRAAACAVVSIQLAGPRSQVDAGMPHELPQTSLLAVQAAKVPVPISSQEDGARGSVRRAMSLGPRQVHTGMPGVPVQRLLAIENGSAGSQALAKRGRPAICRQRAERARSRTPPSEHTTLV